MAPVGAGPTTWKGIGAAVTPASGTTDERADIDGLRVTAANSAKWAVLQMVGATGGRLLFTFALARFLGPDDFGIVAQAMIYISLAMLLLDQGFGSALVQRRRLDDGDVRSVASLNLFLALGLMVVTMVLAPFVAEFFNTPELTNVLRVLGVGLVVKGLAIVPLMMSRRAFQFRELAILQTVCVVVGGIAGLVAVASGAGYWALVVQTVVGDALLLVGLVGMRGLPRFGLKVQPLQGMLRFSIPLLGAQMLMFVGQNADNVVIGRVLGSTALAYYALSYRLQRFPLQLIGSAVNDVSLPVFSRLQHEPERREAWFLTATRFVVLLTWPILVLVAVGANIGVPFLFGDDWSASIVPLQLLSLGALSIISRWMLPPLLTSCGRTDVVFRWSLANVILLVVSFPIAVHWGINAVAATVGLVALATAVPQTVHVCRVLRMSLRDYVCSHGPVLAGCVVLAGTWAAVAALLERSDAGPAAVLGIATPVAVAAYSATVRLLWPTVALEARSVLKLAHARRVRWAPGSEQRADRVGPSNVAASDAG